MFTLSLIALLISTVSLSTMAYFGVLKYGETSEDDDSEKTVKDLSECSHPLKEVGFLGHFR